MSRLLAVAIPAFLLLIWNPGGWPRTRAATVENTYARLPLAFEPNLGQTDPQVKFLARGPGYNFFLTADGAVLSARAFNLQMKLLYANSSAAVGGEGELAGRSNYFTGNNPARWRANIPTYQKVRYAGVYPGIDVVYYGSQQQLEYDFIVAPGRDPAVIRLVFAGSDRITIDERGDLVLAAAGTTVRLERPRIYQEVGGAQREVAGGYVVNQRHEIGFRVGDYDRSLPLVIDPVLASSTLLGGLLFDFSLGVFADSAGSVYLAGYTASPDFPTTPGAYDRTGDLILDAFVTKINAEGTAMVFSTLLGGSNQEYSYGVAADESGVYLTGYTASTNFPTAGAFQSSRGGGLDIFVAKFSPDGSQLRYATYLGGSGDDVTFAGAALDRGRIYVTGFTSSINFPTTAGAFDTTCGSDGGCNGGNRDAFVAGINPSFTGAASLAYSTFLGGSFEDEGRGVAVDPSGNVYAVGYTNSPNFPVTTGAYDRSCGLDSACNAGFRDGFIARISPAATGAASLLAATYLGGSGTDVARAVALDPAGSVYVTGSTGAFDFPTTAGVQTAPGGGPEDGFVSKLNAQLSTLVYSTYIGGGGEDVSHGIAVDTAGSAYVAGYTNSANFPTRNPIQATIGGGEDAFVAKLGGTGAVVYSTFLGGSEDDRGFDVAVTAFGVAQVTGYSASRNFPVVRPFPGGRGGAADAFLARILDGPPEINAGGVVNGASFGPRIAGGLITSLFGLNLAASTASASAIPLPATLAGARVSVNGVDAPLFFVSPTQVNFQLPWEALTQTHAGVAVTLFDNTSAVASISLSGFAPGIFSVNASGTGQGAVLIAGTADLAAPAGGVPGRTSRPVQRGEFISIFCAGLGAVSNRPANGAAASTSPLSSTLTQPTVTIGGVTVAPSFSGLAPGFVALYQVNARVPANAPVSSAVPVSLSIGGATSNPVTIAVQ